MVEIEDVKIDYFGVQSYWGITKHMGSLDSTKKLAKWCEITQGKRVLDVGCGVGMTDVFLVKEYNCEVVGVDINEGMVERARERIKGQDLERRVRFEVASAEKLPFPDGSFDVVLSESVTTFVKDKKKALSEYYRVLKKRGYLGLNEEYWRRSPSEEVIRSLSDTWDIKVELPEFSGWGLWVKETGFELVRSEEVGFESLKQASGELKRIGVRDYFYIWMKVMVSLVKSAGFRKYVWNLMFRGMEMAKAMKHLGYGLYVGRK